MDKKLYLDYAATAPVNPKAFAAYVKATNNYIGNPSSPHSEGHKARQAIEDARRRIAKCMGCEPHEIIFTSGGTESNNIAMKILCPTIEQPLKVITTTLEHHSAQRPNTNALYLRPDKEGFILYKGRSQCLMDDMMVQFANSDIGTIQDIKTLSNKFARNSEFIGTFFTDAVQAVGHIPINLKKFPYVDMLSASAHKFGGVKGCGFLYLSKETDHLTKIPLMYGGSQERGLRAGTENVPAIMAMAIALEEALDGIDYKIERRRSVQKRIIEGLSLIPDAELNGATDLTRRLPNNVSFSFKGILGDTLVAVLDAKYNIIVSAGAACESGNLDGNRIVKAIGKSKELAKGTIRITFGDDLVDDTDGVDYIIQSITDAVKELRKVKK